MREYEYILRLLEDIQNRVGDEGKYILLRNDRKTQAIFRLFVDWVSGASSKITLPKP